MCLLTVQDARTRNKVTLQIMSVHLPSAVNHAIDELDDYTRRIAHRREPQGQTLSEGDRRRLQFPSIRRRRGRRRRLHWHSVATTTTEGRSLDGATRRDLRELPDLHHFPTTRTTDASTKHTRKLVGEHRRPRRSGDTCALDDDGQPASQPHRPSRQGDRTDQPGANGLAHAHTTHAHTTSPLANRLRHANTPTYPEPPELANPERNAFTPPPDPAPCLRYAAPNSAPPPTQRRTKHANRIPTPPKHTCPRRRARALNPHPRPRQPATKHSTTPTKRHIKHTKHSPHRTKPTIRLPWHTPRAASIRNATTRR